MLRGGGGGFCERSKKYRQRETGHRWSGPVVVGREAIGERQWPAATGHGGGFFVPKRETRVLACCERDEGEGNRVF